MTNCIKLFLLLLFCNFNTIAFSQCPLGTTLTGNADSYQNYSGMLGPTNSLGAPDSVFTGNISVIASLILDLTDVVPPGEDIQLYLKKTNAIGVGVVETSPDGFNFYDRTTFGATDTLNALIIGTLTVTVPTRFVRFSVQAGTMQFDAISYDFCPDTDNDGFTDSDEIVNGTDPNNACEPTYLSVFYLDCDGDGFNNSQENALEGQNPCLPTNTANACDDDGDTVSDAEDRCPNTPPGTIVNSIGCPTTSACQFVPPSTTVFTPELVWNSIKVDGRETPLIGDVTGDGITDVVVDNYVNRIYVVNGQTGAIQHNILVGTMNQNNSSNAIGDVDGDGYGEIFTLLANSQWVRLDFDGNTWTQQLAGDSLALAGNNKFVPGLADFDGDGNVELFSGSQIWRTAFDGTDADLIATAGINYIDLGGAVAIDMLPPTACADCHGLELVMSGRVFSVNLATGSITEISVLTSLPAAALLMRSTSVADMDGDGDYDVVFPYLVTGGVRVIVWEGQTDSIMLDFTLSAGFARAGRINIADFDGDGALEMGLHYAHPTITNRGQYGIIDDIINAPTGGMLWEIETNDRSGITGSSVFDFDGDGAFEVVYRDETSLRILNGKDGFVRYMTPCTSGTRWEYPVVADVNGDGETNLICTCRDVGLSAFASQNDPWVPSRSVWNQHAYNVTNINDDLTIPKIPNSNLTTSNGLLNNFLVQSPRLDTLGQVEEPGTAEAEISTIQRGSGFDCEMNAFEYEMTILSFGDKAIPSGFFYTVYDGNPEAATVNVLFADSIGFDVEPLDSISVMFSLDTCPAGPLYIILNDGGTNSTPYDIAGDFPITDEDECDYLNNIYVFECRIPPPPENTYGPYCQGSALPDTVTTMLSKTGHNLYWYDDDPLTTGVLIGTGVTIDPALFAEINVAGTYTAYVIEFDPNDPLRCESPATMITVLVGSIPTSDAAITGIINCKNDCNGTITINTTDGSPPFNYTWAGPTTVGNTAVGTGLCVGSYTITIVDDAGCIAFTDIMITEPDVMVSTVSSSNPTCQAGYNGTATSSPTGGTLPYFYQWDSGAYNQIGQTAYGLNMGTYTVTATDNNGCATTGTVTITEPPKLGVVVDAADVSCPGLSDGSISLTSTGGIPGYTYQWDAAAGNQTTPILTGLALGTYWVTVTDSIGCFEMVSVFIDSLSCDPCADFDICATLSADPNHPISTQDADGDGASNQDECADMTDPCDPCIFDETSVTLPITADQSDCSNLCPDLSPIMTIVPGNIAGASMVQAAIEITELNNVDTDGAIIVVRMPSDPRLVFVWDIGLTMSALKPVNNADWNYLGDNGFVHTWTYNGPNLVISGGTKSAFGFHSFYDPQSTDGQTTLTVTVLPFAGGECNPLNNTDSERLVYFK